MQLHAVRIGKALSQHITCQAKLKYMLCSIHTHANHSCISAGGLHTVPNLSLYIILTRLGIYFAPYQVAKIQRAEVVAQF